MEEQQPRSDVISDVKSSQHRHFLVVSETELEVPRTLFKNLRVAELYKRGAVFYLHLHCKIPYRLQFILGFFPNAESVFGLHVAEMAILNSCNRMRNCNPHGRGNTPTVTIAVCGVSAKDLSCLSDYEFVKLCSQPSIDQSVVSERLLKNNDDFVRKLQLGKVILKFLQANDIYED